VWKTGCLDAIALDLAWITAYVVGLCFMSIPSHILAIVSTGILLRISDQTSVSNGWHSFTVHRKYRGDFMRCIGSIRDSIQSVSGNLP